jgi:hypothetical protein
MKNGRIFFITIEFIAIALLAFCAAVSLSDSGLYSGLSGWIAKPWITNYLTWVIGLVLLAFGIFWISVRNHGAGVLTVIVIVLASPSLLSFNNIDLLKIFGGVSHITTQVTFIQMISIGSLIITLYLLLDLTHQIKLGFNLLESRQAGIVDLQNLVRYQGLICIILAGSALLISILVTLVARGVEFLVYRHVFVLAWWIVPVSLACISGLSAYLYWITTHKTSD